jgi:CcmD family protein
MIRRSLSRFVMAALLVACVIPLAAGPLAGQAEELASQGLGRAYWHVFVAYAVAWILILGWVVSIARRLGRVERSLQAGD